jgi:hypothetical protein
MDRNAKKPDSIFERKSLSDAALDLCLAKKWSLDWRECGCCLHLEASELVEAYRGKGDSSVKAEAADTLIMLAAIVGASGLSWDAVVQEAFDKIRRVHNGRI